jgi:hypothetical protein
VRMNCRVAKQSADQNGANCRLNEKNSLNKKWK